MIENLDLIIAIITIGLLTITFLLYFILKYQLITDQNSQVEIDGNEINLGDEINLFRNFKGPTNKKYRYLNKAMKNQKKDNIRKGVLGEFNVFKELSKNIDGNFKIFNEVYIPTLKKGTTEIDLLLVHTNSIFVIEVKNIKSTKNIKEASDYIEQNKKHIDYCKKLLKNKYKLSNKDFHSVIVFCGAANIENIRQENDKDPIITDINNVSTIINNINKENEIIFNDYVLEAISKDIKLYLDTDGTKKKNHSKHVKRTERLLIIE